MNCPETRRLMSPYLDSELDPTKTFEISEHLRSCEACRWRFEAERCVDQEITARLKGLELPEDTWRNIENGIVHSRRGRWLNRSYWSYWPYLAAAAALALVVWVGTSRTPGVEGKPGEWAIQQLAAETGGGTPYVATAEAPKMTPDSPMPLMDGLNLGFLAEAAQHHVVEMVSVSRRSDAVGEIVEVRLNCCGEPVLLAFARADNPGALGDVVAELAPDEGISYERDGVNVIARRVGQFVALGVSRHALGNMLDGVVLQ